MNNSYINTEILKIQKILNRLKFYDNNKKIKESGIVEEEYIFYLNKFMKLMDLESNNEKDVLKILQTIEAKPLIKIGTESLAVKYIQWFLGLEVNGRVDMKTKSAIIKFQNRNKLATDGIVGMETWNKIIG